MAHKCYPRCTAQSDRTTVTSSDYPNLNTFFSRSDVCYVVAKIVRVCGDPEEKTTLYARYEEEYKGRRGRDICTDARSAFDLEVCTGDENLGYQVSRVSGVEDAMEDLYDLVVLYAKENVAVVKVFYKEPYYTSVVKSEEISFNSFIGNTGGLMGLCMGMSFVSVAEFVYHVLRFSSSAASKRSRSKVEDGDSDKGKTTTNNH